LGAFGASKKLTCELGRKGWRNKEAIRDVAEKSTIEKRGRLQQRFVKNKSEKVPQRREAE